MNYQVFQALLNLAIEQGYNLQTFDDFYKFLEEDSNKKKINLQRI